MIDSLGPHAIFIIWAYVGVTVLTLAVIIATASDARRQKNRLAQLESQGVRRRSAASSKSS